MEAAHIADDVHAVVLVEGLSDRVAIEALAERRGRDLAAEGVSVVPIGGAQAIRRALDLYGPPGLGLALAGLCDVGEERSFRRGLEHAGLGTELSRDAMERLGFYVCEADLEDELIRAVGADRVQDVVAAQGELETFRNFQNQLFWREKPVEAQLRRWLQNGGRYLRYPPLLVEALEPNEIPRPLVGVLTAAAS